MGEPLAYTYMYKLKNSAGMDGIPGEQRRRELFWRFHITELDDGDQSYRP